MGDRTLVQMTAGTKSLPGGAPLLTGVDLTVRTGQSVAVLGRSGAGKSTLLGILALMDRLDSGAYALDGRSVTDLRPAAADRARAATLGFVFQRFCLIPYLSAVENIEAPLLHRRGLSARQRRHRAADLLDRVGLREHARQRPGQLSGGEQQRVAIARALVGGPQVVLADEPTGSLDTTTATAVLDLLLESVTNDGTALVLVTHDPLVAARADTTLVLSGGSMQPAVVVA